MAAFGYYAGFAGSALGIDIWAHKQLNGSYVLTRASLSLRFAHLFVSTSEPYPSVKPFSHEDDLIAYIKGRLDKAGMYCASFSELRV